MSSVITKQWHSFLKHLASRDGSVELSRRCADQDDCVQPTSYRTRLLGLESDGSIIVERPQQAVLDRSFGKRDDVEMLLVCNAQRLIATCTILDVFMHQVNPNLRICCYRLSPARRPQVDQRRAFYRVGLAALDLPLAELWHEKQPVEEDDEPTIDLAFKARLVNLSAGGLGVSVRQSRAILNQIKHTRDLTCRANFGDGEPIVAPVLVRHVSGLGDDGLYLGLQFSLDDAEAQTAFEDRMHQRCMQFQREALRRKRA